MYREDFTYFLLFTAHWGLGFIILFVQYFIHCDLPPLRPHFTFPVRRLPQCPVPSAHPPWDNYNTVFNSEPCLSPGIFPCDRWRFWTLDLTCALSKCHYIYSGIFTPQLTHTLCLGRKNLWSILSKFGKKSPLENNLPWKAVKPLKTGKLSNSGKKSPLGNNLPWKAVKPKKISTLESCQT